MNKKIANAHPGILTILAGLLLSIALTGALLSSLTPEAALAPFLLLAAGLTLPITLAFYHGFYTVALLPLIVLLGALPSLLGAVTGGELAGYLSQAVRTLVRGGGGLDAPIVTLLQTLLCLGVALLSGLAAGRRSPWIAVCALGLVTGALWLWDLMDWLFYGAMALAAIVFLALLRYQYSLLTEKTTALLDRLTLPAVPVALVLVALCLVNTLAWPTFPQSQAVTQRINYIDDALSFSWGYSRPRTGFSLRRAGYAPLSDRLGGAIERVNTVPVLRVTTNRSVLLKGSVANEYTGYSWVDTTGSSRHALGDGEAIEEETFSRNKPTNMEGGHLMRYRVTVETLSAGTSTLFVPFRMDQLAVDGFLTLKAFYNPKGEVFSSRNVAAGTRYTIQAQAPNFESGAFQKWYRQNADQTEDAAAAQRRMEVYGQVPDSVPGWVRELALEITGDAQDDLSRALAIRLYLAQNYTYTLHPENTPAETDDFVAFFLQDGEGYCTYFASAMTILARYAGLPARYVEGYSIVNEWGVRDHLVSAQDAHAWSEVYIAGLGWIPMDAQAVDVVSSPGISLEGDTQGGITETPPPEEDYVPPEAFTPEQTLNKEESSLAWLWIIPGAALLIAAIALLHPDARRYRRQRKSLRGQVQWEYEEILRCWACYGHPADPARTPSRHRATLVEYNVPGQSQLDGVLQMVERLSYTRDEPRAQDVRLLQDYHRTLVRRMPRNVGLGKTVAHLWLRLPPPGWGRREDSPPRRRFSRR